MSNSNILVLCKYTKGKYSLNLSLDRTVILSATTEYVIIQNLEGLENHEKQFWKLYSNIFDSKVTIRHHTEMIILNYSLGISKELTRLIEIQRSVIRPNRTRKHNDSVSLCYFSKEVRLILCALSYIIAAWSQQGDKGSRGWKSPEQHGGRQWIIWAQKLERCMERKWDLW